MAAYPLSKPDAKQNHTPQKEITKNKECFPPLAQSVDPGRVAFGRRGCWDALVAPVVLCVYAGMPSVSSSVCILGYAGSPVHCLAPKAPAQPYSQSPDVRLRPDQSAPRHASSHQAAPS